MRRPRRDVIAVATACAGLTLAAVGMPAHAAPTTSSNTTSTAGIAGIVNAVPFTATDEPTEDSTDQPTDEATDDPDDESSDPTADPTDESEDDLSDEPTAPPTDDPPEDPDDQDRQDPGDAYEEALRDAQTVAVAEAEQLRQQALADIDVAEEDLELARADAASAKSAQEDAAREAKVASEVVNRTQREIKEIEKSTDGARNALGNVVSEAYQNNGMSTVGVLLGSDSPKELTDRYVGMQTLLRASDTALGQLAADEANLRGALDKLEGQRKEKDRLAEAAADKLAEREAAESAAEEAQAAQQDKLQQYEKAMSLAEEAALEDYERYMEQLDESTAVSELLANLPDRDTGADDGGGDDGDDGGGGGGGSGTFVRPGTGDPTSPYGQRLHPILGYVKMHTGLDFSVGDGNVYAADSGTVVEATYNTAYGNMVIIDHGVIDGQQVSTLYAHQAGLSVSSGQSVDKGQVIGQIGSTGYSTGPHLHFEVRLDGQHTDPGPWLEGAESP